MNDTQGRFDLTSLAPGGATALIIVPYTVPLTAVAIDNNIVSFPPIDHDALFFNNMAITPEPGIIVPAAACAILLLARGRGARLACRSGKRE